MKSSKNWKLFRCIYDEMGQYAIEGEGDEGRFEKCVAKGYGDIGWLIGLPVELRPGWICVRVVLEGDKNVLEYVLGLIKEETRAAAEQKLSNKRGVK